MLDNSETLSSKLKEQTESCI